MFFFIGNIFGCGTLKQYADLRVGFENWTFHHCPKKRLQIGEKIVETKFTMVSPRRLLKMRNM